MNNNSNFNYDSVSQEPNRGSKGKFALFALGALALAGVGGYGYINSDVYQSGQILSEAEQAAANGNLPEAMGLYKTLFETSDYYRQDAKNGIAALIKEDRLSPLDNTELAQTLDIFNSFDVRPIGRVPGAVSELISSRVTGSDIAANSVDENIAIHELLHAGVVIDPDGEGRSELDAALAGRINDAEPSNLAAAVEVSEAYLAADDLANVKAVLVPVQDQLGESEAARTLGQIYIAEGNNAEAYPLLSAYTSSRLQTLRDAEKAFTDFQTQFWEDQINLLSAGQGPQSFYTAYDRKTPDEQALFMDEYIAQKLEDSQSYGRAFENYRNAAAIVPVVMDFGILQLRAAETMTDEAARNAELKAAEETFLSINNIVGDTDEFKLYLGQVYFWLGKQEEGQILFDEVLVANERSADTLLDVAHTMRALGRVGSATELANEAYESGKGDVRYGAANLMHLLSNTIEERITWLERSQPDSPYVQAALRENQGHLAAQRNDPIAAADYFREAIRYSESLADGAVSYNNTALIYFALHRVSQEQGAYRRGTELMKQAVELQPDNGIQLSNAAATLITNSLYETISDDLDYGVLQSTPSLSSINYHYANESEKSVLRDAIAASADMQQAIAYFERSVLLSPNSLQNYADLSSIYYFLRDENALVKLAEKMAANQIDTSVVDSMLIDQVNGVGQDENLENLRDGETYFSNLLLTGQLNRRTEGAVHLGLARNLISQVSYDQIGEVDRMVKHAEDAFANLPVSGSRIVLTDALLTRASVEAAAQFSDYEALRTGSSKRLSDSTLAILAMGRDDEIANWLKAHADVRRVVDMEAEDLNNFPESISLVQWAVLNAAGSDQADRLAASIRASDLAAALYAMSTLSAPLSAETLANSHLLAKLTDGSAIDPSRLEGLEELGIGVPAELFR